MDRFFSQLMSLVPKNLIAFLAIAGGIAFIILFIRPPHSLCDSQLEVINQSQRRLLFKDPKSRPPNISFESECADVEKSGDSAAIERCKEQIPLLIPLTKFE